MLSMKKLDNEALYVIVGLKMLKTCERQLRTWRNSLLKSFLYTLQLARRMGWGEGRPLVSPMARDKEIPAV
jgi:hypothetical protein